MEKPSTFDRIGASLKRSAHGTALFTDSQRSARDELPDLARTRQRNLRRDHGTTVTVEQVLKEIFPNPGSSDGAIQLEWEPEGRSTWEVDYQLSFGFDGTALLNFATNDRSDVEVAILRSRNNSQLKIAVQADRIRVLPATKDDDDGTVLTTGQELLKAWNESGAAELVTLNVGRGELPVPVTGTVLDGIKRIGDRLEYVDPYMEIRTSRSARPQIVAWHQGRGILGDLERKYHVSFNAPQILAMREEARQVLEAELYEAPTAKSADDPPRAESARARQGDPAPRPSAGRKRFRRSWP